MAKDIYGIDRNRTYNREEICQRFGYDPDDKAETRNLNRFFRDNFLRQGLNAVPVGRTYEVSGEIYFAWTMARSRPCSDDEIQADQAKPR